jgi:hypothetical protein
LIEKKKRSSVPSASTLPTQTSRCLESASMVPILELFELESSIDIFDFAVTRLPLARPAENA